MVKDPRSKFELSDIYRPLEESNGLVFKHMFGGMAVYAEGLMKFVHCEGGEDQEWKGQVFDYPLWNGLLVCTDYPDHDSLLKDFPELANHPILKKWLYLPLFDEEDFRRSAKKLILLALKNDPRIGITPNKSKRRRQTKPAAKNRPNKKAPPKTQQAPKKRRTQKALSTTKRSVKKTRP